jgi:hypothetical protein
MKSRLVMGSSVDKAYGDVTSPEEPQPVFRLSLLWATAGFAISLVLASIVAARYFLFAQPPQIGNSIGIVTFVVSFLVLSLIGIFQSLVQPVWSAKFYPNHAVINGRRSHSEINYSFIEQVSLVESLRTWPFVTRLSILLKGGKGSIILSFNPFSRNLGTSLSSWLDKKIREQEITTRSFE